MKIPHHGIGSRTRGSALCFALLLVVPSMSTQPQRGLEPVQPLPAANGGIGNFYALVIGINDYHAPLPPLKTAVDDGRAVGKMLEQSYGFKVQYLLNADATRFNILDALAKYEGTLQTSDNLVIYFAGHGYLDPKTKRAYWMPYDANSTLSPNRIISDELMNEVSDAPARHVLVISDSCYSGDLANTRGPGSEISAGTPAGIARMLGRKSRNLMASGGEEAVSDAGVDGHSVFAGVLLRALAENVNPMFTASSLFYGTIKDSVVGNSMQTPEYAVIPNSTHNGGDFVFVRNGKAPLPAAGRARGTPTVVAPEPEPEGETATDSSSMPTGGDVQRSINQLRMTIPNIAAALSSADVRFLKDATAAGVRPAEIEQGLRQKAADGKSTVAQEFFQSAAHAPEALAWFGSALEGGARSEHDGAARLLQAGGLADRGDARRQRKSSEAAAREWRQPTCVSGSVSHSIRGPAFSLSIAVAGRERSVRSGGEAGTGEGVYRGRSRHSRSCADEAGCASDSD